MIDTTKKTKLITEICTFLGTSTVPPVLKESIWVELDSGIWLLSPEQADFFTNHIPDELQRKIKYAGLYIGKIRKNFGLSLESLYPLRSYITRYVTIKGKTLQKYLYGKSVTLKIRKNDIENLNLEKIVVMSSDEIPVGISSFIILEKIQEQEILWLTLKLEPITDLGMFLRNERKTFE